MKIDEPLISPTGGFMGVKCNFYIFAKLQFSQFCKNGLPTHPQALGTSEVIGVWRGGQAIFEKFQFFIRKIEKYWPGSGRGQAKKLHVVRPSRPPPKKP